MNSRSPSKPSNWRRRYTQLQEPLVKDTWTSSDTGICDIVRTSRSNRTATEVCCVSCHHRPLLPTFQIYPNACFWFSLSLIVRRRCLVVASRSSLHPQTLFQQPPTPPPMTLLRRSLPDDARDGQSAQASACSLDGWGIFLVGWQPDSHLLSHHPTVSSPCT